MKILSLKKDEDLKNCLIIEYKSFFKTHKRRAIRDDNYWRWCDRCFDLVLGFDAVLNSFNECSLIYKEL